MGSKKYAVDLSYGTQSGRAVLVEVETEMLWRRQ